MNCAHIVFPRVQNGNRVFGPLPEPEPEPEAEIAALQLAFGQRDKR